MATKLNPLPRGNAIYWVSASLAMALLPHLPRMPWWAIALAGFSLGWRLWSEKMSLKPLAQWIRILVTFMAIGGVVVEYGTLVGRQAAVVLLAIMLLLKLMETYRMRDARLLAALTFFVIVTQFLYDQSIEIAIFMILSIIINTVTLMQLQIAGFIAAQTNPVAPPKFSIRRGLLPQLKRAGLLLLQAIPITILMFVIFPRLSSPMWGLPEDSKASVTGISDEMSPGSITELFTDDSPAFRVVFESEPPPPSQRYWRGPVLWNYDGLTWRADWRTRKIFGVPRAPPGLASYRYEVTMEPSNTYWLFTLDKPVAHPDGKRLTSDFQALRKDRINQLTRYKGLSLLNWGGERTLSYLNRALALELPAGLNPRAMALAERWSAQGLSAAQKVQASLAYFREQPFFYTHTPPKLGRNAMDEFLFETRQGFCEHYASAFTVLMRAAGVPARIVTGYTGGYFNDTGGYLLLRQSDAHAWSEVWLENQGWVRVDPTAAVAPDRIIRGSVATMDTRRSFFDFPWIMDLRNSLDSLNHFWNDWVISFDAEKQEELAESAGLGDDLIQKLGFAVALLVPLMLALGSLWLQKTGRLKQRDAVQVQYQILCKKLAHRGVLKNFWEGPAEYSQRAQNELPNAANALAPVFDLYIKLRYSGTAEKGDIVQLKTAVRGLVLPKQARPNP